MDSPREIVRLRAALAELPQSLSWRVEESARDGFGAVADTGEVPAFVFRNCGDDAAEAIVAIMNAAPYLLDELERLSRPEAPEVVRDAMGLANGGDEWSVA